MSTVSVAEETVSPSPIDFDSPEFLTNPWPAYRAFRARDPVHWLPKARAFLLLKHTDVARALADRRLVTDFPVRVSRRLFGPSMLDADGPRHRHMRQVFTPLLGHPAIVDYGVRMIAEVVEEVVSGLDFSRDIDFVRQVAIPVPYGISTRLIGLPRVDDDWLRERVSLLARAIDFPSGALGPACAARAELEEFVLDAVRSDCYDDGPTLLKLLIDSGSSPDNAEFLGTVILFLLASTETSVAAIGMVLCALLSYGAPAGFWTDAEVRRSVIKETLRLEPPTHTILRYAATDLVVRGIRIPRHSAVLLSLASANRDEEVFVEPDRWLPDRHERKLLPFGAGPHTCLGIHLVYAEFDALFERLAMHGTEVYSTGGPITLRGHGFRGPESMTVHWGYARASSGG